LTTKDLRSFSANLGVDRLRVDYVELVESSARSDVTRRAEGLWISVDLLMIFREFFNSSAVSVFAQTLWAESNTVHSSMLICTHLLCGGSKSGEL